MKVCSVWLCLVAGCGIPSVAASPVEECRESDVPASCPVPQAPPGWGSVQGPHLEGVGLERLSFTPVDPLLKTVFPPPAGSELVAKRVCGAGPLARVKVRECAPITPWSGSGVAHCTVDVEEGNGICGLIGELRVARQVVIVRGWWDAKASWVAAPGALTLSCSAAQPSTTQSSDFDGAVAKCTRYDPATRADMFLACIRMERADYCGDGHPHTVSGTRVVAYDAADPMTAAECRDGQCFEATWSKDGVVCLARTRWQGLGMTAAQCQEQFQLMPRAVMCRPGLQAVLSNRSGVQVCGVAGTKPCTSDQEPVCTPP
jgi:hypothetical protein